MARSPDEQKRYDEEQAAQQRQQGPQAGQRSAAQPAPAAAPPLTKEEQYARARGAQVILAPDSDASLSAKGAIARTMVENTEAHKEALISEGLDPLAPSAEQTDKPAA